MPRDGTIRAFVALEVSEDVREALFAVRESLADLPWARDVRWVKPENFHLTLRFLGDVSPEFCDALAPELDRAVGAQRSFELRLRDLTAFPSTRRPRVIVARVHEDEAAIQELASAVERKVVATGAEAEPRRFRPHITLGRLRKAPRGPIALEGREVDNAAMRASEVVLIRSELLPQGARYTALHRARLRGRARGTA